MSKKPVSLPPEIRPGQSLELLKELHILTRDGKLNQDSRRKLKQVYHLAQFIEPLLNDLETLVGILQEASQWWAANDVPFWAFMTVESPAPPAR